MPRATHKFRTVDPKRSCTSFGGPRSDFERFCAHFGLLFGGLLGSLLELKSLLFLGCLFYIFGVQFGGVLGSKMEPFGTSKELWGRSCDFSKTMVLLKQKLCFRGWRGSKTDLKFIKKQFRNQS